MSYAQRLLVQPSNISTFRCFHISWKIALALLSDLELEIFRMMGILLDKDDQEEEQEGAN